MNTLKNNTIIKFLTGTSIKTKTVKLAIIFLVTFLMFLDSSFAYIIFTLACIYIAFEFSYDSVFWLILIASLVPWIEVFYLYILMWEMIAILLIKIIRDIVKKKIDYKNWKFITPISLLIVLSLLMVLPLSKAYSFTAQINRVAMFAVLVLGAFYVKEINIKDLLMLFTISIISICVLYSLAQICGHQNDVIYLTRYSKGNVERFSAFNMDPNFTGSMLICAIATWFFMYKKDYIKPLPYYCGLGVIGYFALITISKATWIIIGLFAIYVVMDNIAVTFKTNNAKNLTHLLLYITVFVVVCAIGWKYVNAMFYRLRHDVGWWAGSGNFGEISNITTGRIDLWADYLKAIFSSAQILLFGAGAASNYVGAGGEHCIPLAYLYRYGLISTLIMVIIFVVAIIPHIKKTKVYNWVPIILITGIYCSVGSISAKYIYIFALSYLTLCYNSLANNQELDINT